MIDHLVYATPDLEATTADLERVTGVRLSRGGSHPGLGTRNRLADLGDGAYLEVVGPDPDQPAPAEPRPFGLDDLTSPRLVTWALRVSDLDAAIARALAHGHDPGPATTMSRRLPDGTLLEWRLTVPPGHPGILPFLIDWGTSRHPSTTAAPGLRLDSLTATHPSPDEAQSHLSALSAHLQLSQGPLETLTAHIHPNLVLQ